MKNTASNNNRRIIVNNDRPQEPTTAPSVQLLIEALRDQSPVVQYRAILTLGRLGSAAHAAVPELRRLRRCRCKALRAAARVALQQIG